VKYDSASLLYVQMRLKNVSLAAEGAVLRASSWLPMVNHLPQHMQFYLATLTCQALQLLLSARVPQLVWQNCNSLLGLLMSCACASHQTHLTSAATN
jgi:hypothetical protein